MIKDKNQHINAVGSKPSSRSKMSRSLVILFATACGMAVANITYAQPLLEILSQEFKIPQSNIGMIMTITQVCYALGLLMLVPLGDRFNQRLLIICQMLISALSLVIVGISPSGAILFIGIAAVGFCATVTQTLVAYASLLSEPEERGQIVGVVTSGIVVGILLARTFAGLITDWWGWRSVYLISAFFMLVMTGLFHLTLPTVNTKQESLTYVQLLYSVLSLFVHERMLFIRGVLALLIFTVFNILWTSITLPLSTSPYFLSPSSIGLFGLVGAAGALGAVKSGYWADQGLGKRTTGGALFLLLIAWLLIRFTENSLFFLIIGVILLDLAVQAVHVINQSMIFSFHPEARSRLTAAYMIYYSIGSAAGSMIATIVYANHGWLGVCVLGASVSALSFLFWLITLRLDQSMEAKHNFKQKA